MTITFNIPKQDGTDGVESITLDRNLVIIGANGSGKSRLGIILEQNIIKSHRISAQRALTIPDFAQVLNLEQAENSLYYGQANLSNTGQKWGHRWQGEPAIALLNDYNHLLSTLFARRTKRDRIFIDSYNQAAPSQVPESEIEVITHVWKEIMPHRQISFADGH
jgi:predicted ATP-dependent endonuclease of OLD family